MYNLLQEILLEPDWSQQDRLLVALKSMANEYASSVADSGHVLAMSAASGCISKSGNISEIIDGLSQVGLLNQLVADFDYGVVIKKLKVKRGGLLSLSLCSCVC